MFQLSEKEWEDLRSQIVTASLAPGGTRSQVVIASHRNVGAFPYVFTEQGVAMLSSGLRSARAVEVNIATIRPFVQLRRLMDSNRDLACRIEAMEVECEEQFAVVFDAIKRLMAENLAGKTQPKRRIGF
jgi:hypothetical protein